MKVFICLLLLLQVHLLSAQSYKRIDSIARNTTSIHEQSMETLVTYLVSQANSDEERARILFTWVATHVQYDYPAFFKRKIVSANTNTIWKNRMAQCGGYSALLKQLCDIAQIPCEVIDGYARDAGNRIVRLGAPINHSWNAIKINGKWQLMDVTWAASHLLDGKKIVNEFDDFWFSTDPAAFVYFHFPKISKWQLLEKAISVAQVNTLNLVEKYYYQFGINAAELLATNLKQKINLPLIYEETKAIEFLQFPSKKTYALGEAIRLGIKPQANIEYALSTEKGITVLEQVRDINIPAVKGQMHFMMMDKSANTLVYNYFLTVEGK
jgi:hypothetical protein